MKLEEKTEYRLNELQLKILNEIKKIQEFEGIEDTQPKTKKCSNCNSDVPVDSIFCNKCGNKFEKIEKFKSNL